MHNLCGWLCCYIYSCLSWPLSFYPTRSRTFVRSPENNCLLLLKDVLRFLVYLIVTALMTSLTYIHMEESTETEHGMSEKFNKKLNKSHKYF